MMPAGPPLKPYNRRHVICINFTASDFEVEKYKQHDSERKIFIHTTIFEKTKEYVQQLQIYK